MGSSKVRGARGTLTRASRRSTTCFFRFSDAVGIANVHHQFMTIAMCYLSPEGVVLGADSTSSALISPGPGMSGYHYFNYAQKLYQLGEESTAGVLNWSLGGFVTKSYRTLIAEHADDLRSKPAKNLAEVADRWCTRFWDEYSSGFIGQYVELCKDLDSKKPFDQLARSADPATRTREEEDQYQSLKFGLVAGTCVGGYWPPDRTPAAYWMMFDPLSGKPEVQTIDMLTYRFWGAPNPIKRLIFGSDDDLKSAIMASGKWNGTEDELNAILDQQQLAHGILPIRDAIDFVHACIYSTTKARNFRIFSKLSVVPLRSP